jgi:hypothetical protein
MFAYWFLFAIFAFGAFISFGRHAQMAPARGQVASGFSIAASQRAGNSQAALLMAALPIIILIGFRYQVGTDFPNYVRIFKQISRLAVPKEVGHIEIGYATLNWLVAKAGAGFWLVNLVCALLFTFGLIRFAKIQPNPWLALTVSAPYLINVVGMGYSRQAVALGLGMAGLAAVSRGSFGKFVAYVLAGALFHRSAVVLLPIVTIAYSRNRLVGTTVGIAGLILGYFVLVSGQGVEHLERVYITHTYLESQGAAIRLAMNAPPGLAFLLFMRRFSNQRHERLIYGILSVIAFLSMALLFLYPEASTPLDRMALYVIPLQLFVLSRLPSAFPDERGQPSALLLLGVILFSAVVQFVWLNYAYNARDWVPYQFYPFDLF